MSSRSCRASRQRNWSTTQITSTTATKPAALKAHKCNNVITHHSWNIEERTFYSFVDDGRVESYNTEWIALGRLTITIETTLQETLDNFTDLDPGKKLNLSRSFVWHGEHGRNRKKRDLDIEPGETLVTQCYRSKIRTESGNLRICPVCTTISRQTSQRRLFPECINELLCDTQANSSYFPRIDGYCVQKTFLIDLLEFNGRGVRKRFCTQLTDRAWCLHRNMGTAGLWDKVSLCMRTRAIKSNSIIIRILKHLTAHWDAAFIDYWIFMQCYVQLWNIIHYTCRQDVVQSLQRIIGQNIVLLYFKPDALEVRDLYLHIERES